MRHAFSVVIREFDCNSYFREIFSIISCFLPSMNFRKAGVVSQNGGREILLTRININKAIGRLFVFDKFSRMNFGVNL